MNWEIVFDKSRLTSGVQLEMSDDYLPLIAFFAELRPSKYVGLVDSIIHHRPIHTEMSGIRFAENLDGEDEADGFSLKPNECVVHNREFGENIIQVDLLQRIAKQFLEKFVELHASEKSRFYSVVEDAKRKAALL